MRFGNINTKTFTMKANLLFLLPLLLFTGLLSFRANAQDGTLDATYGVGGRALTPVPSFFIQGGLLAVDAQNRAVVCGVVEDGYFATRLLENGQVDPSFGNAGIAVGMPDSGLTQDIQTALALPGNKTLIVLNAYGQDTVDETRLLVLDASGQ